MNSIEVVSIHKYYSGAQLLFLLGTAPFVFLKLNTK